MCGIAGYLGSGDAALVSGMIRGLHHRGPDDQNTWIHNDHPVGFGHTRLSILDLSAAGTQPMHSADSRITLCYNGELYDHAAHRHDLERLGYQFRGSSDSEVLLNLYHQHGVEILPKLNGMFAFAAWDAQDQSLTLARDAMGVKPLYYTWANETLLFASEIKPLLRARQQAVTACPIALETFLNFLYVPGHRTLFEGIYKLEPGTYLKAKSNLDYEIVRWYQPTFQPADERTEHELVEAVREELQRSVKRQIVSDVPVGAFLSGGIDSSALVALASESLASQTFECFAATYPDADIQREGGFHDLPFARQVANHFQLPLHITEVTPDCLDRLPGIVDTVEEPDADLTAIVTSLLAESAQAQGSKVLLSGTGGDEVFHGYRTHQAYQHFAKIPGFAQSLTGHSLSAVAHTLKLFLSANANSVRRAERFARALPLRNAARHLAIVNSTQGLPMKLSELCTQDFYQSLPKSDYLVNTFEKTANIAQGASEQQLHSWLLAMSFLSDHNFLYTDRCSMQNSIEVRVPFMDKQLMELCNRIPAGQHVLNGNSKHLLKSALRGVLPDSIINRPKMGFNPPVRTWIAQERNALSRDLLDPTTLDKRGIFNAEKVSELREKTRTGQVDGAQMLFAIQYLELWFQRFIDEPFGSETRIT